MKLASGHPAIPWNGKIDFGRRNLLLGRGAALQSHVRLHKKSSFVLKDYVLFLGDTMEIQRKAIESFSQNGESVNGDSQARAFQSKFNRCIYSALGKTGASQYWSKFKYDVAHIGGIFNYGGLNCFQF